MLAKRLRRRVGQHLFAQDIIGQRVPIEKLRGFLFRRPPFTKRKPFFIVRSFYPSDSLSSSEPSHMCKVAFYVDFVYKNVYKASMKTNGYMLRLFSYNRPSRLRTQGRTLRSKGHFAACPSASRTVPPERRSLLRGDPRLHKRLQEGVDIGSRARLVHIVRSNHARDDLVA